MKLLLFDIDGTLLDAQGHGRRTIEEALSEAAGRPVASDGVPFAGRTDRAIAEDMVRAAGMSGHEALSVLQWGLAAYAERMQDVMISGSATVLPGIESLLQVLVKRSDIQLGLLTGNLRSSAYAKLRAVRLDRYFPFGAFGSDATDRYELPAIALERANRLGETMFDPASTVVIGDTEHDVGCGRAAGMQTVAVCTGLFDRPHLAASLPDLLLDDFSDPLAILSA